MNIILKKLTSELCEDFLYYFDYIAFSDHEEWSFCYCLECHLDQQTQETFQDKLIRREMAKELILKGGMNGYLAYDENAVVGWCNADDKISYKPLQGNTPYTTEDTEKGKIKVVYCYDIAPNYRGRGIADLMLKQVCKDAKKENFTYVEAYPFLDKNFPHQYHGTMRMYERNGFEIYMQQQWFYIMRKKL